MRVMVFVKATEDSEKGVLPSTEMLEAMGKYNEELVNAGIMLGGDGLKPSPQLDQMFIDMGKFNEELVAAGVLLAGDGLKPSSHGKRVAFDGPSRTVIDGPFAETRELVAGFWIWEVKDMDEAIAWARRCPNPMPGPSEIEIRPLFEMEDFADLIPAEAAAIHDGVGEKLANR